VAPALLLDEGLGLVNRTSSSTRTLVVGCGNLLRGDDAVGPVLVRHLAALGTPPGVRLADGGTAGMDVAFAMRGQDTVVVVDASTGSGHPAGTLYRVPGERLEHGRAEVENAYARAVPAEGNPVAQAVLADVFEVRDRVWRGIGMIPRSGWQLAPRWRDYDAEHRFDVAAVTAPESSLCRSGEVLQGLIKPSECSAFGKECTPRRPLGATMVSNEGACAAYFQYRRLEPVTITARPEVVGV